MYDNHGMPVPHKEIKFPLRVDKIPGTNWYGILDADNIEVHYWEMPEFFVHAANWIMQTRDIVERVQFGDASDMCFVVDDATELWSQMKKSCINKSAKDNIPGNVAGAQPHERKMRE